MNRDLNSKIQAQISFFRIVEKKKGWSTKQVAVAFPRFLDLLESYFGVQQKIEDNNAEFMQEIMK